MSYKSHVHGDGESYGGIVPAKQPNKSGRPPAEVVEGRLLTKENMDQQNLDRTPSRENRPNELDRVREAMCLPRQTSKVGTVCASSASTGLCGGQRATAVPTATRVMPAEERALTSGGLVKEGRSGDGR